MAVIEIKGIIGKDYLFSHFLTAFAATGTDEIRLQVNSPGGSVNEGNDIARFIAQKADRFASVTNTGDVMSIASNIFLSLPREKRFFDISKGRFVIHNPFADPESLQLADTTAAGLAEISAQLDTVENDMAKFIAKQTGSDVDLIKATMKINKPLSEEQITTLNLATVYQYQAVAFINNNYTMKTEEVQELINKSNKGLLDTIKSWFKKTTKFVNIVLTDATGAQIDFPDVAEGTEPMVGDTAVLVAGGELNGDVVMADGKTYTFDNGTITNIVEPAPEPEPEPEPNPDQTELEALKAENAALKQQIAGVVGQVAEMKAQIKTLGLVVPPAEPPAEPAPKATRKLSEILK